jgi:hypothetical protein
MKNNTLPAMTATGKNIRLYIYSIALLALLLQSLIPFGFMPSVKKDGAFRIEICTSSGLSTIIVGADKAPFGKKHAQEEHSFCPYAPVLSYSLTGQQNTFLPVIMAGAALLSVAVTFPRRLVTKDWFSQGPPLSLRS